MPGPTPSIFEELFLDDNKDLHFIRFKSMQPYLDYAKKYGDLVHYHLSRGGEFVLASAAEDLEEVYSSPAYWDRPDTPYIGYTYGRIVGLKSNGSQAYGIANGAGPAWDKNRRVVDEALAERIPQLLFNFNRLAHSVVQAFRNNVDDKNYVPQKDLYDLIVRFLVPLAYGTKNVNEDVNQLFLETGKMWFQYFYKFIVFQYKPDRGWPVTALPLRLILEARLDAVHAFAARVLKEKRATGDYGDDWMGRIASAKDAQGRLILSDEEVLAITFDTFFLGTFPGMVGIMEYSFYVLGANKDVQEKLVKSLENLKGDVTLEYIKSNTYLQDVVRETMRHYPPGGGINARKNVEKTGLNVYVLPNNTNVIINGLGVHTDPRYWSNPEKFFPERFRAPYNEPSQPYAYTPFGAGRRRCPGYSYASIAQMVLFANIYKEFDVTYPHKNAPEMIFEMISRPKEHYSIVFKRR